MCIKHASVDVTVLAGCGLNAFLSLLHSKFILLALSFCMHKCMANIRKMCNHSDTQRFIVGSFQLHHYVSLYQFVLLFQFVFKVFRRNDEWINKMNCNVILSLLFILLGKSIRLMGRKFFFKCQWQKWKFKLHFHWCLKVASCITLFSYTKDWEKVL